jgi:hypothetical protein
MHLLSLPLYGVLYTSILVLVTGSRQPTRLLDLKLMMGSPHVPMKCEAGFYLQATLRALLSAL